MDYGEKCVDPLQMRWGAQRIGDTVRHSIGSGTTTRRKKQFTRRPLPKQQPTQQTDKQEKKPMDGSAIHRSGIEMENLVIGMINTNKYRISNLIASVLGIEMAGFKAETGQDKTKQDIIITSKSSGRQYNIQVKKFEGYGMHNQVHRARCDSFLTKIGITKGLTHTALIDLCLHRKQINTTNYTQDQLDTIQRTLQYYQKKMAKMAIMGNDLDYSPDIHILVNTIDKKARKIYIYRSSEFLDFIVAKEVNLLRGTDIALGCMYIHRKGGDGKKATANQIQCYICPNELIANESIATIQHSGLIEIPVEQEV